MSLHLATEKFISLIPTIISDENLQILEVDWKTETSDSVQLTSKRRIVSGKMIYFQNLFTLSSNPDNLFKY